MGLLDGLKLPTLGEMPRGGSTRRLSGHEEAQYIDRIRVWLAHEYGAVIPDPARLTSQQGDR